MNLNALVITLLATVAEGRIRHYSALAAVDPPSGATCYRGNMKQHPTSGHNTPPCWYQEPDSSYSCYEYENGTNKCPNFPNKVTRPGSGNTPKTCYRGNMKQHPTSGPNTPPCWYKEPDHTFSCYEYEPSTGKCPNFPNPISKPTFHLRGKGNQKKNDRIKSNRIKSNRINSNLRAHYGKLPQGYCIPGGMGWLDPVYDPEHEMCWVKDSKIGEYACFDKINGECPF